MQSTLSSLPEFHHVRDQSQASPKLRDRYIFLALKPRLHTFHPLLQHVSAPFCLWQNTGLRTRPRSNLTPPGPERIIVLTLARTQPLHFALHPNLPLHLMPPKRERRAWVRGHVFCLAARAPIAVDDEASVIEFFEIDETGGDAARGQRSGGEAYRLGLVDGRLLGVCEPGVELGEGGRGELMALQGALGVLIGLLGGAVARGSDCFRCQPCSGAWECGARDGDLHMNLEALDAMRVVRNRGMPTARIYQDSKLVNTWVQVGIAMEEEQLDQNDGLRHQSCNFRLWICPRLNESLSQLD